MPPALEEVPQTIETVEDSTSREIPPSHATPPVAQPEVAYDTGLQALSWAGKSISSEQTSSIQKHITT